MPLRLISTIASASVAVSGDTGSAAPVRITSATRVSKRRPSAPPGCERAKSSAEKPRASSSASASASPSASAAVVLAVGARPSGHASSSTAASRCTSAACASELCSLPVSAMSRAPSRFRCGVSATSSSVSPELDSISTISSGVIIPRSPCDASAGCTKNAGVPVEASVAASLRPMWPDLPIPETTIRPRQLSIISTAATNGSAQPRRQRRDRLGLGGEHVAGERKRARRIDGKRRLAPTAGLFGHSPAKYSFSPCARALGVSPLQRISTRTAKGRPEPFVVILNLNDAKYRASRSRGSRSFASNAHMPNTLKLILVLLAAAVVVVVVCRLVRLPAILGYLLVGIAVGPHGFAWVPDDTDTRELAEFGIVFLMFSIGLEFSLPHLRSMQRAVFGLGLAQVAITTVAAMAALHFVGYGWKAGLVLGGALAMSSTAIVSKMLAERMELSTPHGRDSLAILLFQDLAVVAFLIVIPSLGKAGDEMAHGTRHRRRQGRRRADADPVLRPEADARVVPRRRAAAVPRTVRAQRAAGHAGLGRADRDARAVAGAGRLPGRHADRGNRVPLPGRGRHQAVPRRAARPLLRHDRHGARHRGRRGEPGLGRAAAADTRPRQVRAHRRAGPRLRFAAVDGACAPGSISRRPANSRW